MRIIPKHELMEDEYYEDMLEFFSVMGIEPVFEENDGGVYRFRTNDVIRYLLDYHQEQTARTHGSNRGLNLIVTEAYTQNKYTLRDMVELYMAIGYSLCGFYEIFGECIDTILRISYDRDGNQIAKLGPSEETEKYIDGLYKDIRG